MTTTRIGVLALQGSFKECLAALERQKDAGVVGVDVRTPADLALVDQPGMKGRSAADGAPFVLNREGFDQGVVVRANE